MVPDEKFFDLKNLQGILKYFMQEIWVSINYIQILKKVCDNNLDFNKINRPVKLEENILYDKQCLH